MSSVFIIIIEKKCLWRLVFVTCVRASEARCVPCVFRSKNLGFVGNYRVFRGFRHQLGLGIDPSRECIGIAGDHREKTPDLR